MIHLIIFSRDRACQLDCLLRSIQKYTSDLFNISIIYKSSSEDFENSYSILQKRFPEHSFHSEIDFQEQVLNLICQSVDHIAFSTDDTVIYRLIPLKTYGLLRSVLPNFDNECFSFRLGLNTIIQNPHTGELQPILNKYSKIRETIFWNCMLHHPLSNYGYPFAMDMHVYKKTLLEDLMFRFNFQNSNQLESELFKYRYRVVFMSAFQQSVAVNVPINNLSQVTEISKHSYALEDLNQRYLNNEIISLESFNENVIGCHQLFQLKFEKNE